MLTRMRRERSGAAIRHLIDRIRRRVPDVALRSAFIVGFPGETDADFEELAAFLSEARLDHVGVFRYSREEGTEAGDFPDQVPAAVKRQRHRRLMTVQSRVAAERNRAQIGRVEPVLVCGEDGGRRYGRTAKQAPDIDGVVYLAPAAEPGTITSVKIVDATIYDLEGVVLNSAQTPVDSAMDSL